VTYGNSLLAPATCKTAVPTVPRYALLTLSGRRVRVRVLDYRGSLFRVLDGSDTVRFVSRDRLTFLP
jgi:hypothetical protein